jgi:type II secretory pathway pseudopilin PulG
MRIRVRRRAITLLEILVSIVLIGVLCSVLALIMNHTMQTQRLQAATFDRLQQSRALAEQFRADVARAKKAPDKQDEYVADEETLILQMNDNDYVVYLWRDGALKRLAFDNGNSTERPVPAPFGMNLEFLRPKGEDKLVRLRLTPVVQGRPLTGQSIDFAAALGGDWR